MEKKCHVIFTLNNTKSHCGMFNTYNDAVEHVRQQIGGEDNPFTLDEMNEKYKLLSNRWGTTEWEYEIIW